MPHNRTRGAHSCWSEAVFRLVHTSRAAVDETLNPEFLMIRKLMLTALVAIVAVPFGTGTPAVAKAPAAAFDDATFVNKAAIGGMFEVYLCELAATSVKNADVKKFAAMLQKEHSTANESLKTAAKEAMIDLPTKLDDAHQKQYNAFKDYKGNNYDLDFKKTIVQTHTACEALLTQASKAAKSPALKEFATKTLPTIQKHLEMAKKLDS